jgi:hypothetical protein
MTNSAEKRIQITSNYTTNSSHVYERVEDNKDGSVTVHESNGPVHSNTITTVRTKPYEFKTESKSLILGEKKDDKDFSQVERKEKEYDTSQL